MQRPHAPSWDPILKAEFASDYWTQLESFVDQQRRDFPGQIYPPEKQVFAAFEQVARPEVKVVILGQDPYHQPGQAHGLAFSVPKGVAMPPSLKNIFRERQHDLGLPVPEHGCLVSWARQGVLLLNTVLTVRRGAPHSHRNRGWEVFTNRLVGSLGSQKRPVVFLLWGRAAAEKCKLIASNHHAIIQSAHPSPLSARRGFFGSRPFSRANTYLERLDRPTIDWRLDDGAC